MASKQPEPTGSTRGTEGPGKDSPRAKASSFFRGLQARPLGGARKKTSSYRTSSAIAAAFVIATLLVSGFAPLGPDAKNPPEAAATAPALVQEDPDPDLAENEHPEVAASVQDAFRAVRFEPNRGQAHEDILFTASTASGLVLLGKEGMTFVGPEKEGDMPRDRVHLAFADPSPDVVITGERPMGSVSHYYIGDTPLQGVTHFSQVRYADLYPGIDLVVYATPDGHLEFDHIVAPGADTGRIGFHSNAPASLEDDELVLTGFRLQAPVAWQEGPGGREPVQAGFEIGPAGGIGYALGEYAPDQALTIDPVLNYASYLDANTIDQPMDIAVGPHGDLDKRIVYVGGTVESSCGTCFPTPAGFGTANTYGVSDMGRTRAFVAKMVYNVDTKTMSADWFAYIGGGDAAPTAITRGKALDFDPTGGVVIAGDTTAHDLPTMAPLTMPLGGSPPTFDGSLHSGAGTTDSSHASTMPAP